MNVSQSPTRVTCDCCILVVGQLKQFVKSGKPLKLYEIHIVLTFNPRKSYMFTLNLVDFGDSVNYICQITCLPQRFICTEQDE